jgi:hypothetical protein
MRAHSDDLQRGMEADRYTADAILHYNGGPTAGPLTCRVVIWAGRTAAARQGRRWVS